MVNEDVHICTCSPELWVRCQKLSCMRVVDVFDVQACDTRIMCVSWQVYPIIRESFYFNFLLTFEASALHFPFAIVFAISSRSISFVWSLKINY